MNTVSPKSQKQLWIQFAHNHWILVRFLANTTTQQARAVVVSPLMKLYATAAAIMM